MVANSIISLNVDIVRIVQLPKSVFKFIHVIILSYFCVSGRYSINSAKIAIPESPVFLRLAEC